MAAATVGAELAIVNVVGTVTIAAARAEPLHSGQVRPVAALAGHGFMRALEREIGQQVVIEHPGRPFHRVVTRGAVVAETAIVRVVFEMAIDARLGRVAEDVGFMAIRALGVGMCAEERESREVVVEKYVLVPGRFVVAILALDPLFALVGIVRGVTVVAARLQRHVENGFDVAVLAFDGLVSAAQGVLGVRGVIEVNLCPHDDTVTGFALFPEMTFVFIVFDVAIDAGGIEAVGERIVGVTIAADQLRMPALQGEVRIPLVIETGIVPRRRVVAGFAVLAAAAVVYVILGVAAKAGDGRLLERLVLVAVTAGNFLVAADQGIVGRIVIEFDELPAFVGMTIGTCLPERILVHVVFPVAGIAIVGCLPELRVLGVAAGAFCIGVLAAEHEIRLAVIERCLVEFDDVRIPALVIGVAARAGRRTRCVVPAVEAAGSRDVLPDVLVACDTKGVLSLPFEEFMAVAALRFGVRVRLHHVAGHDQRFDRLSPGRARM